MDAGQRDEWLRQMKEKNARVLSRLSQPTSAAASTNVGGGSGSGSVVSPVHAHHLVGPPASSPAPAPSPTPAPPVPAPTVDVETAAPMECEGGAGARMDHLRGKGGPFSTRAWLEEDLPAKPCPVVAMLVDMGSPCRQGCHCHSALPSFHCHSKRSPKKRPGLRCRSNAGLRLGSHRGTARPR